MFWDGLAQGPKSEQLLQVYRNIQYMSTTNVLYFTENYDPVKRKTKNYFYPLVSEKSFLYICINVYFPHNKKLYFLK